jgi:hypothetical protein
MDLTRGKYSKMVFTAFTGTGQTEDKGRDFINIVMNYFSCSFEWL